MLRRLFLLFLLGCLVGLPAAVAYYGIDKVPAARNVGGPTLADLDRAQALLIRFDPRRMARGRVTTVTATAEEIDAALRASLSGLHDVTSRVDINRRGVFFVVSAQLPIPENFFGRYVNLRVRIAPSDVGLEVANLSVGKIRVPRRIIPDVLLLGFDQVFGKNKGRLFLQSFLAIRTKGDKLWVAIEPDPSLIADIKAEAFRRGGISNPLTVRAYYRKLMELAVLGGGAKGSLAGYIGPLFALARERSLTHDPVKENEALLLALAMYFGDTRFENVVGDVRAADMKSRPSGDDNVRLNGRYDFVQHFTISVGLTVAGGKRAANLIGEVKEVRDSGQSSGFSFTDIAADRAGVRFAENAVADDARARRFQSRLAGNIEEADFFPWFTDLPENLSRTAFAGRFGDIDSPAYRRVIEEIDRRLDRLPLYR